MVDFVTSAKQVGHLEQYYKNKTNPISSIKFDSCYSLFKGAKGVHANFIGTPIAGSKKKTIWVPKPSH
jgi:hypothetical protein